VNREKVIRILMIGIVPFMLFVWGKNFGCFTRRPREAQTTGAAAGPVGAPGETFTRDAKRSQYAEWKRVPFRAREVAAMGASPLNLEGIVMDPVAPFAIINGEIKREGEQIGTATVVLIQKSKVILKDGKEELTLQLFEQ
jgi:hypothetical protein